MWAKNGEEAVDIYKSNKKINVILMDIKLPVMNGYEACRIIKELLTDGENIPIIAQTAYSSDEDREKALSKGFDDFMSKPLSEEILAEILERYIKK